MSVSNSGIVLCGVLQVRLRSTPLLSLTLQKIARLQSANGRFNKKNIFNLFIFSGLLNSLM